MDPAMGGPLLATAREAFIAAMRVVALVSAAIVLALAVIDLVLLRHVQPIGQGGPAHPDLGDPTEAGNPIGGGSLSQQMQPEGD
jgi:hypothetical protein